MEEVIAVNDCVRNIGDYDIPIHNAIIISKNATNRDMIEAMFPNHHIQNIAGGIELYFEPTEEYPRFSIGFRNDWLDAPYEAESEDKE